jgi:hypothetical protein
MAIRVKDGLGASSGSFSTQTHQTFPRGAMCESERILQQELEKYCSGELSGRSFLIAGHRGSGKTTMVNSVVEWVKMLSEDRSLPELARPLAVFLHGPSLFDDTQDDAPAQEPATGEKRLPTAQSGATGHLSAQTSHDSSELVPDSARAALVEIILGLHRAVVQEFIYSFRERLSSLAAKAASADSNFGREQSKGWAEIAAQFEIEIFEDPPVFRLREFWELAGVAQTGVLNPHTSAFDQGMRELVALNGMCNAHQRISGELRSNDRYARSNASKNEDSTDHGFKLADFVKPMTSVLAGASVTAAGAIGTGSLTAPAILGLLIALVAPNAFKNSSTSFDRRERQVDTTFMPDLSRKTLDRVLPTLLRRLRSAGLAPVLIIDELDKVKHLPERLTEIINFLKKLLAENAMTCFLTDRGYLEYLRVTASSSAYGPSYSYFSLPLLVSFRPGDFVEYLNQLLVLDSSIPGPNPFAPASAYDSTASDELDLEVLKWMLRHRSKLHALTLAREIAAFKEGDGRISIPDLRSNYTYRIEVTLQVALELQLKAPRLIAWQRQRPVMTQVVTDALYFLSRQWLDGTSEIRLDNQGISTFAAYLSHRMNLEEMEGFSGSGTAQLEVPPTLSSVELQMLFGLVRNMVAFLTEQNDVVTACTEWLASCMKLGENPTFANLDQSVKDCLLMGQASLLYSVPTGSVEVFRWRYLPDGREVSEDTQTVSAPPIDQALKASEYIGRVVDACERLLVENRTVEMPILQTLAEVLRVLPTSPDWQSVASARTRLDLAKQGRGDHQHLPLDCQVVLEFKRLLEESEPLLRQLLEQCAFLSAFIQDATPVVSLCAAVKLLSEGLSFFSLNQPDVLRELQVLQKQIVAFVTKERLPSLIRDTTTPGLLDEAFSDRIELYRKVGAEACEAAKRHGSEICIAAWRQLLQRAGAAPDGRLTPSAQLDELFCAALGIGPAEFLSLDLSHSTLANWTDVLLQCIRPETDGPSTVSSMPHGLIVLAICRLGYLELAPPLQESIERWISVVMGSGEAVLDSRNYPSLPLGKGKGTALGLLIRREASVAGQWITPATQGMLLVLSVSDWRKLRPFIFDMFPAPAVIAIEEPSLLDDTEKDQIEAQSGQSTAPYSVRYIYVSKRDRMRKPFVIQPSSPDQILAVSV